MKNATQILLGTMGTIAGIAGLEHGLGEILQGNVAPAGVLIESWPGAPFFEIQAGEPAMTLIPNLLLSGILTILVTLVFMAWDAWFIRRKHGWLVLTGLCVIMLLVGAGFGPPLLGLVLAAAATRVDRPFAWKNTRSRDFLAAVWPWSLGTCVVAWLVLFPGTNILGYFFGVDSLLLVPVVFFTAFGLLLFSIVAGYAKDSQLREQGQQPVLRAHAQPAA